MSENPYGAEPYPTEPGASGPTPPAAEQPPTIRYAVIGMYVGATLSAIGALVTFLTMDQIRAAVEEGMAEQDVTADMVDAAVAAGVAIGVVIGLIGVAVWIWMAIANGRGRSWARIVATVLGGLNIVFTPLSLGQEGSTGISATLGVVGLLLAIGILVLLWMPASSAYYRARSQRFPA